ncbi:ABC transporter ATP-binding protein [uncultured Clostridium sp.]|uniref:ABC transporter ATP-binding protein n=1 Tax=uncultured Clostridium sp. TaxID=59620 RepID=UPI0028E996A2|nr:ABC transporter ATP-binding protein [uncultured Clostridium sp.]
MLKIEGLSCGYDNLDVVKNIAFHIERGNNLCIVGPNGCGKSTLLKSIANLIDYKGNITLDSKEIRKLNRKKLATKVALMSQSSNIYFPYTVFETVLLGRYAHINGVFGKPSNEDKDMVLKCLDNVGILDLKNKLINELSGGQLQRVYLARAFAQDPEVILLDEPTNHLDLRSQIQILEYLKGWTKENNRIVIAVLHDLNLVQTFGEKVLLLNEGQIIKEGTPKEVFSGEELKEVYGIDIKGFMINALKKWKDN